MAFPLEYMLDLLAAALWGVATACRATQCGMHFTGAVVLGGIVGIASPLLRDSLLGFAPAVPLRDGSYIGFALAGALLGRVCAVRLPKFSTFFWSDALALAVSAALGTYICLLVSGASVVGSIVFGTCIGIAGSLARDVCLGDVPQALDQEFYTLAAAMGSMLLVALAHFKVPSVVLLPVSASVIVGLRYGGHWRALRQGIHG